MSAFPDPVAWYDAAHRLPPNWQHIIPAEHARALRKLLDLLRPGGVFWWRRAYLQGTAPFWPGGSPTKHGQAYQV